MKLATRLDAIAPSATLALNARAQELRAQGKDVVSLTAGEPDFPCPEHIVEALAKSARDGATRYTPVPGLPAARDAVAARYRALGRATRAEDVILTVGGKQALYNALMSLLDPDDEVIVPSPYWLSYRDMVQLAQGRFIGVPTAEADGFTMSADALRDHLTSKTRVVILNSPANPTGAAYDRAQMEALVDALRPHPNVVVIFDEIYDRIVYPPHAFVSPLDVAPDFSDRAVIVNGGSKTYAMTGLRIGWAVAPEPLVKAMSKLQGQSTSNASAPVQHALVAALEGDQSFVDRMRDAFGQRRDRIVSRLRAIDGVTCFEPKGAFYAFPNVEAFFGRRAPDGSPIQTARELCEHLVANQELVVVPGEPFGAPGNIRLSFATDMDTIERGLDRLEAGLAALTST